MSGNFNVEDVSGVKLAEISSKTGEIVFLNKKLISDFVFDGEDSTITTAGFLSLVIKQLANVAFEQAHMNLTRHKAEEVREAVLNFEGTDPS